MANVNLAALDMFRTAKDWTADSIANLDGRSIKNVGEYGGALSALSRSSIEKSANNEMRTELLKSLANAFDMQVMTDNDGKARFTKEFLRNLERKIGAEFKRDDFKLDADGYVCSGRPLTARRIRAIVSKVTLAALDQGRCRRRRGGIAVVRRVGLHAGLASFSCHRKIPVRVLQRQGARHGFCRA